MQNNKIFRPMFLKKTLFINGKKSGEEYYNISNLSKILLNNKDVMKEIVIELDNKEKIFLNIETLGLSLEENDKIPLLIEDILKFIKNENVFILDIEKIIKEKAI